MNRRFFMELLGIGTAGAAAKVALPFRREAARHPSGPCLVDVPCHAEPGNVGKHVYLCDKEPGTLTITPPVGSTSMSMGKIIAFHGPDGARILVTPMGGTNVRVVL